jgi:hypothetical protein
MGEAVRVDFPDECVTRGCGEYMFRTLRCQVPWARSVGVCLRGARAASRGFVYPAPRAECSRNVHRSDTLCHQVHTSEPEYIKMILATDFAGYKKSAPPRFAPSCLTDTARRH